LWQILHRFWQLCQSFALLPQGNTANMPRRDSVLANPPAQMIRASPSKKEFHASLGSQDQAKRGVRHLFAVEGLLRALQPVSPGYQQAGIPT
jgi:hypothetical protein